MCYRIATPQKDKLVEHVKKYSGYQVLDYDMYYNAHGFARPFLPVELNTQQQVIQPAMWGLIPGWTKSFEEAKTKYKLNFNGVGEKIFETPSYKNYVRKHKALLWVDGFFETEHIGEEKQPHFIYAHNNEPFTMGCVWSPWLNPETKEWINTFTVVTTPANELMSKIHNSAQRMPLIIPEEKRLQWLNATGIDEITELIKPLPEGYLSAHKVSKLVNQTKIPNNVPEVQICS